MTDLSGCVDFLQRLIQTPSLSGGEGEAARLVSDEMTRLAFDSVTTDRAGNVIGLYRGRGRGSTVMLNTHLDHVDPGDPSAWEHAPYGGDVSDGRVWGRGAVDIKGPLASQVYAVAALAARGERLEGDVLVSAVVLEEVGGLGAKLLIEEGKWRPDVVVIGEPSGNTLRCGHRGRVEFQISIEGRSVHASIPDQGVNALEPLATLLMSLDDLPHLEDPRLGKSTVAPTLVRSDQSSPNVIPGRVVLHLDWRTVPEEDPEDLLLRIRDLARRAEIPGANISVDFARIQSETYTGVRADVAAAHPAFFTPSSNPFLQSARHALGAAGLEETPGVWRFATDGGHFAAAGIPVIGWGPGDETLAHTVRESIEIEALERAIEGYGYLARALSEIGDAS